MGFLLGSLAVRPLVQIGKFRAFQPWKKDSRPAWIFIWAHTFADLYGFGSGLGLGGTGG